MGKMLVKETAFPEIVEQYNNNGRPAAYAFLRSHYGLKNPYFVIKRIKECGEFTYDPDIQTGFPRLRIVQQILFS